MVFPESVFFKLPMIWVKKFLDHKGESIIFKSSMWNFLPEKWLFPLNVQNIWHFTYVAARSRIPYLYIWQYLIVLVLNLRLLFEVP